jgi:hypothetical protein
LRFEALERGELTKLILNSAAMRKRVLVGDLMIWWKVPALAIAVLCMLVAAAATAQTVVKQVPTIQGRMQ